MKRFFSNKSNNIINITNKAWNKLKYISKNNNNNNFIFFAQSGGCNGFNYKLTPLEKKKLDKYLNYKLPVNILENQDVKVIIDPKSEILLFGTKIDYITEDFEKGIFENKFIYIPDKNLTSSCGCGISFTPKKI